MLLSRRSMLRNTAGAIVAAAATNRTLIPALAVAPTHATLFAGLDAKIEAAMAKYHIPGVAVGVFYNGREYVRGYGVTNVEYPVAIDGETLFRIGSVTKTFTGTSIMRLGEARPRCARTNLSAVVGASRSIRHGARNGAPAPQPQRRLAGRRLRKLWARRRCAIAVRRRHAVSAAAYAARPNPRLQQRGG